MANQINVTPGSGAQQVIVESGTGNVTVTISRAVIGTVANVPTANFANYANIANTANTAIALNANINNVSISGGTNGYFLQTDGTGNLTWANGTGGGGNGIVAGSNTQIQYNDAGAFGGAVGLTYNNITNVTTIANANIGSIRSNLVPNANITYDIGNNTNRFKDIYLANSTIYLGAQTINANATNTLISGVITGNGAGLTNLSGANISGIVATANYANYSGNAYSVDGANVFGSVANATYANTAGAANSVAGANVVGTVANANYSAYANVANTANSVSISNVSGIGNIATVNLDGNVSNVLRGDGSFAPEASNLNANYANFAGNAFSVTGSNVSGEVANANYATYAGTAYSVSGSNVSGTVANANFASYSNIANTANAVAGANVSGEVANANFASYSNIANTANSVAVANVSGIGNIATVNLDGNSGNILYGNGIFAAAPNVGNATNANYANFAGDVVNANQPNITTVGTLGNLAVTGNITANTVTANYLVGNVSLTSVDSIYFDTAANVALANVGQVAWDDGEGTLQLLMKGANVTQQVGAQEYARVYNAEANTLSKGEVVYIYGAQGNRISVKRAQANTETTSIGTLGFVAENIATASEGYVIVSGALYKLNTNGLTAGNVVYLSPSVAGGYTTTKPVAPDQLVVLGWVERVDAAVGSIYVKVDNGYELDELHNVLITSPTAGQALVYNASNLWVNGNPNLANTANTVTNNAQSNITSVGNLISLTVDNAVANTPTYQFNGNGITIGPVNVSSVFNIYPANNNTAQQATVIKNYVANAVVSNAVMLAQNTGNSNTMIMGYQRYVASTAALNASNVYVPAAYQMRVFNGTSDLANANTTTYATFQVGSETSTSAIVSINSGSQVGFPIVRSFSYGNVNNNANETLWQHTRRRGNSDSRSALVAGDYLGTIEWRPTDLSSTGTLTNNTKPIRINPRVDASYTGANNERVPMGFEFEVTSNSNAALTHYFYANGNVLFNNSITSTTAFATANITTPQFISNVATGTAPFVVSSTTKVANLNADTLDGYDTSTSATANTIVVRNTNGNITGNYFIGNGSQLTNVDAATLDGYDTSTSATANTVVVRNSDGNITGNYFIGNGSQLTGITAGSATEIANGNSNVNIPSANGNINLSVAGNANVLIITGSGIHANIINTNKVVTGGDLVFAVDNDNDALGTIYANAGALQIGGGSNSVATDPIIYGVTGTERLSIGMPNNVYFTLDDANSYFGFSVDTGLANIVGIDANGITTDGIVEITGYFAGGTSNITYSDLANTCYLASNVAQGIHITIPANTAAGLLTINASNIAINGYSRSHFVYVTNYSGNTQNVITSGSQEDLTSNITINNNDSLSFTIFSVNQFVTCRL